MSLWSITLLSSSNSAAILAASILSSQACLSWTVPVVRSSNPLSSIKCLSFSIKVRDPLEYSSSILELSSLWHSDYSIPLEPWTSSFQKDHKSHTIIISLCIIAAVHLLTDLFAFNQDILINKLMFLHMKQTQTKSCVSEARISHKSD